jgi:diguanylate cyclase (GGDEF)-like protein
LSKFGRPVARAVDFPERYLSVSMAAFLIQLGLHGLTGALAFLVGLRMGLMAAVGPGPVVIGWLALVVLTMAAVSAWIEVGRRLAHGREAQARRVAEARVDHLTRHDALTGLPNRGAFLERLHARLGGGRRSDRMVAVLCVNLADFKAINDILGCVAGDVLLRHTSARLLAVLRDSDMLARMGADEFAILQNGIDGPAGAADLCERLLAALAEPFDLCGHLTYVGARIGIAAFPSDGSEAEALLQHAGQALGRAKAEPPGTFRFFEEAMDIELRERKALEQDLVHALERSELEIEYQPQFDIASRRMVGVEALLRWQHPKRGRIGPDQFIPLAEDSGLILPIGRWVLEQACLRALGWQQQGAHGLRMAVNLSPVQFRDPNLASQAGEILLRSGLAAEQLELEITERVLMQDTEANLQTLSQLKALGIRISIDDFGVGHSSLSYLRRFPFDEIKLDRSFVGALDHDPSAAAIVRATLSLSRSLGLDSVAEGVESAEQLRLLGIEGCRLAQGYYFSPPVHPREIDAMVAALTAAPRREAEPQELRGTG